MKKILLLEDDIILQEIIEEFLTEKGYDVECFYDGEQALDAATARSFDMLLLDVNVPEVNGFELLEYLREIRNHTPAIFITSLNDLKNLRKGFELGAEDYLKKPFDLDELAIRIAHHLRGAGRSTYRIGAMEFLPERHLLCTSEGETIPLKQKESKILAYLLSREGRVVSSDELIENLWDNEQPPTYATIRTYIKNLRKALGHAVIENIKGEGYRIAEAE
ncbi:response regulator transcription factor [Nitratifractor sp.]